MATADHVTKVHAICMNCGNPALYSHRKTNDNNLVQLGEKDQGCKMIAGIKKQYPNAKQSVIQKAQYEQKKFKCKKV